MLEFTVKNFGPIRSADVRVKPLTIFVGPNNSGKSYLAMLLYTLCGVHQSESVPASFQLREFWQSKTPSRDRLDLELRTWLAQKRQNSEKAKATFGDLPASFRESLEQVGHEYFRLLAGSLSQELRRCFGTELSELVSYRPGVKAFSFTFSQSDLPWSFSTVSTDADLRLESASLQFEKQKLNLLQLFRTLETERQRRPPDRSANNAILQLARALDNSFPRTFYLPAARSGILQSHKTLASVIIKQAPLAGLQRLDVPQLSGIVSDFISELLVVDEEERRYFDQPSEEVARIGGRLETGVLDGKISIETKKPGYPEIYYDVGRHRFPLYRTSSMVSELAPLTLLLKQKVNPGHLLIVEEPESHLHPANQRKFARAIVGLVRCGVNVMLTTHSDYFLSQLSNFVRLGDKSEDSRKELGFARDEFLKASEVSGYLIAPQKKGAGSNAVPLRINSIDGIPEKEFSRVAESLYQEMWEIADS